MHLACAPVMPCCSDPRIFRCTTVVGHAVSAGKPRVGVQSADCAISKEEYPNFIEFVEAMAVLPDTGSNLYYDDETGMWKIYQ